MEVDDVVVLWGQKSFKGGGKQNKKKKPKP